MKCGINTGHSEPWVIVVWLITSPSGGHKSMYCSPVDRFTCEIWPLGLISVIASQTFLLRISHCKYILYSVSVGKIWVWYRHISCSAHPVVIPDYSNIKMGMYQKTMTRIIVCSLHENLPRDFLGKIFLAWTNYSHYIAILPWIRRKHGLWLQANHATRTYHAQNDRSVNSLPLCGNSMAKDCCILPNKKCLQKEDWSWNNGWRILL